MKDKLTYYLIQTGRSFDIGSKPYRDKTLIKLVSFLKPNLSYKLRKYYSYNLLSKIIYIIFVVKYFIIIIKKKPAHA